MAYFSSDRSTNPVNQQEDWDSIMTFCDQINKELEGPQISVRLIAHKVQSPQPREALYALAVSDFEVVIKAVLVNVNNCLLRNKQMCK